MKEEDIGNHFVVTMEMDDGKSVCINKSVQYILVIVSV